MIGLVDKNRGFRACWVQFWPSFCSPRNGSLFMGWVFNINFVQSADLTALHNTSSKKFNKYLLTLLDSSRTDKTRFCLKLTDLHFCLPTQHYPGVRSPQLCNEVALNMLCIKSLTSIKSQLETYFIKLHSHCPFAAFNSKSQWRYDKRLIVIFRGVFP